MDRKELEALTVKQLQDKLVEYGYTQEDATAFKTKAPLIASLLREVKRDTEIKEAPESSTPQVIDENDLDVEAIEASKKKDTEEKVEKVNSINERPNPKEEKQVNKAWKTKAETMKAKLLGQDFVNIIVPLETGEKLGVVIWVWSKTDEFITDEAWGALSHEEKMLTHQVHVEGAFISPTLNGYRYFIPKGRYYKVPMQIAKTVTDSQQQTLDAGKHIDIDRVDPRTNRPFREVI